MLAWTFDQLRSGEIADAFHDYLKDRPTRVLVERAINAFTPDFIRFLRRDPRTWTLAMLLSLVTAKPDEAPNRKRGLYLVIATIHLYGGSSRVLPYRFWQHSNEAEAAIAGEPYEKKVFYDKCAETGTMPSYVHVANDSWRFNPNSDEEDHGMFLELLETSVIIMLDLFHSSGIDKPKQRNLASTARHPYLRQMTFPWNGTNSVLPCCAASQEMTCRMVATNLECRHCYLDLPEDKTVEHLQTMHNDFLEPYNCPICDKAMQKGSISRHVETHDLERPKPWACDALDCDQAFPSRRQLAVHAATHDQDRQRPWKCTTIDCGKAFYYERDLKDHRLRLHTDLERKHKCERCPSAFRVIQDLNNHIRRYHSNRPSVICDECGQHLADNSKLKDHKTQVHSNERAHRCTWPGCESTFKLKGTLTRHVRTVHERHKQKTYPQQVRASVGLGLNPFTKPEVDFDGLVSGRGDIDTISSSASEADESEFDSSAQQESGKSETIADHVNAGASIQTETTDHGERYRLATNRQENDNHETTALSTKRRKITLIVIDSDDDYEPASPKRTTGQSTIEGSIAADFADRSFEKAAVGVEITALEPGVAPSLDQDAGDSLSPKLSKAQSPLECDTTASSTSLQVGKFSLPKRRKTKPYECSRCLVIKGYKRKGDFTNHMRDVHRWSAAQIAELVRKNEEENKD